MKKSLAFIIVSVWLSGASAADPVAPASTQDGGDFLSGIRESVRSATDSVARRIDSWFGDKPFEQGGRVSGTIGLKLVGSRNGDSEGSVRFNARLDLPNLQEQSYFFFGKENERDLLRDQPEAFTRRELLLEQRRIDDQTTFAGLGYALRDAIDFRAGLRSGYKPFVQARYKDRTRFSEQDVLDFRETVFWRPDDGFGSTTALTLGHAFSRTLAFRWQLAGTFSEDDDGLEWANSFGLFRSFGTDRQLSLEALASGNTAGSGRVTDYGLRAIWQQPVYQDWTIMEFSLGHFWPRDRKGEREVEGREGWVAGVGIDIRF